MGLSACHGIKIAVVGALLVVNDQGWLWNTLSPWLLIGMILIALGVLKAALPCYPMRGCGPKGVKPVVTPVKKGK